MPLTNEQVNTAYASVSSRCQAAIEDLEGKKTFFGSVTGNNDTVDSTIGSLHMVANQLEGWKANGLDLASQGDNASPAKVKGWVDLGNTFTDAISEIDGYGRDATLQAVVWETVKQTGQDIKDAAPMFAIGGFAIVVIIGFGYFVLMSGGLKR